MFVSTPDWLLREESYDPPADNDRYLRRTMLSLAGVLSQLRLDDGRSSRISPSAHVKLVGALACILLVSLSRNYLFVIVMLALLLARVAVLPAAALKRVVSVAATAAAFSFVLMLPAAFIGQPQSALLVASKVLFSVGLVLTVALTTPHHELTGALRAFRVPATFVMTIDLALKSIVQLGDVAMEVLLALRLRSTGRNDRKRDAVGGVGGTVLLKSAEAATATYNAMTCRGFDGAYRLPARRVTRPLDIVWAVGFVAIVVLFVYLEGAL